MFCPNCGTRAEPGEKYCVSCGAALRMAGKRKKKVRKWPWVVLGLAVVVAAVCVISGMRKPREEAPAVMMPAQTMTEAAETQPAEKLVLAEAHIQGLGYEMQLEYRYDENGTLIREDKENGETSEYTYGSDGLLQKEVVSWDGLVLREITYDTQGNPVEDISPGGVSYRYENSYDNENRLVQRKRYSDYDGLMEEETYTYQEDGGYTLDFSDYQEGILHCHKVTTYDAEGKVVSEFQDLESVTTVKYETTNTYDAQGNLTCCRQENDVWGDYSLTVTEYEITWPEGENKKVVNRYVTETARTYDGQESSRERYLERTETHFYDSEGRPVLQENVGMDGGSWYYAYTWEYDANGNLRKYTEGENEVVKEYTYLPLEQVQYS